jgi:molecular chaperone GrpE (heat shock protein)
MKAKLTFDLDDIDDKMAHERCVKSTDMAFVLWEIMTNSYRGLTNGYDEDDSYHKGVEAVYEKLRELLEEHDINPHNLIR